MFSAINILRYFVVKNQSKTYSFIITFFLKFLKKALPNYLPLYLLIGLWCDFILLVVYHRYYSNYIHTSQLSGMFNTDVC